MKEFNEFKNLRFYSQDEQQILEAVSTFKKLGYRVVDGDFNINEAVVHNGFCAWDDGEITSGWLTEVDFEQVTLEELKEMVGGDKDNTFTLERLLGCEVKIINPFGVVNKGHISKILWDKVVFVSCGYHFEIVHIDDLTLFTGDGDELTFDEYVSMYYGDSYVQS